MEFVRRRPAPPLDAFVDTLWYWRSGPRVFGFERVMPTGTAQLIVNLKEDETRTYDPATGRCVATSGSTLGGVATRFQIIDTSEQEHVAGVTFRPGGTTAFTALPAHALSDVDVPLDAVWGAHATARLRERLLAALDPAAALEVLEDSLRAVYRERILHPSVVFALDAFARRPHVGRVADVTDALGVSAKRFIERFKAEVGVTPKRYCRILRFQQALARAHATGAVNWTGVAADCGYFDQAHFIHDFRGFSGMTPTAYEAARTEHRNHVTFLQSETGPPGAR